MLAAVHDAHLHLYLSANAFTVKNGIMHRHFTD